MRHTKRSEFYFNVVMDTKLICKVNFDGSSSSTLSIVNGVVKLINKLGVEIYVTYADDDVDQKRYKSFFVKWDNILDYYTEETMKLNELGL